MDEVQASALTSPNMISFFAQMDLFQMITCLKWEKKLDDVKIRKEDMNKLVMNFLLTEGYLEAAEKFRLETGTEYDIDIGKIRDGIAVKTALQSGNVEGAIEKLNDIDPEILSTSPQLLFCLHHQRLIELIRNGKTEEALKCAQEDLVPTVEENQRFLEDLEKTVALLCFDDPSNCPCGELLDISLRLKIANKVYAAILTRHLDKDLKLLDLLKMLIWVQNQLHEKASYPRLSEIAIWWLSEDPAF